MSKETLNQNGHDAKHTAFLTLGALGVVYGDIGTSPLYALRECFWGSHGVRASEENVLGILSLFLWSLIIVISVKYMVFVLRADNRGEGGILALMALSLSKLSNDKAKRRLVVMAMGLFGAALLYGDGMITPAISVLSAVEGLEVATTSFKHYVVPITIVILIGLFLIQHRGTARIGTVFGPIILVWFGVIASLGLVAIIRHPVVLRAVNPFWAVDFYLRNGWGGFMVLGAVFLALTGGEALYADMGHFGRRPIQLGWFAIALPCLLLNYFGQGAVILGTPSAATAGEFNPFFALTPRWALIPMVVLSTLATIIASQAVISGAFSVTRQAALLGYLPRVSIIHTSAHEIGQIFIPTINRVLLVATVGLVVGFQTSTNLAAAYGVAVTTTMLITTLLLFSVMRELWGWRLAPALLLTGAFLMFDIGFCSATMLKVLHGGWFPLVVGVTIYTVMITWRKGRQILGERLGERMLPLDMFVPNVTDETMEHRPVRVPGAAVFMSGNHQGTPPVMLHNIKYNKVIHETVAVLTVIVEETSHVPRAERVTVENLGHGFYLELRTTGFFLGRENIRITKRPGMAAWRQHLFAILARNAYGAIGFFEIPPNQVVELGVQVEL
ncbi:MAG: potassium transporter Kup [Candidatus Hydrogenedentes bacterium]|nr:potassium transporter Kup [Candidatus Hydrogenedentota bacterium]